MKLKKSIAWKSNLPFSARRRFSPASIARVMKIRMIFNDARNYMNVTRKQYDIIVSEPSNPWIAGVASLFTAEFYDRAAEVLKPDGVFAQWIQLYELDPQDLR